MLLVYYNIPHHSFYQVYKNFKFDVKVGDVNGFGHVLVQIFYLKNDKLYNVNSSDECYSIRSGFKYYKKRFLKRLIRFLNKLEKKG